MKVLIEGKIEQPDFIVEKQVRGTGYTWFAVLRKWPGECGGYRQIGEPFADPESAIKYLKDCVEVANHNEVVSREIIFSS